MDTFIFGHRNPDTDSICSSIALSYLKNKLGDKTIPKTIGHLNNETKFVLKHFNIPEPEYLNDVKIRIRNIKFDKKAIINENATIYNAYQLIQNKDISGIPLIDNNKKLSGFVTTKNLINYLVEADKTKLNTTLDNIVEVIDGKIIVNFDCDINASIALNNVSNNLNSILLLNKSTLNSIIDSNIKLIILTDNTNPSKTFINNAKEKGINVISSKLSAIEITNKIYLSNFIKTISNPTKPITIFIDDYYDDFQLLIKKTKHTNYPVIDHQNNCLGLLSLNNINEFKKQNVILVDHNSFDQSVEGIEEANILEIIDHHNLGNIGTKVPISFRSMIVGCTSTIIYKMFVESNVKITPNIAGIMLSAIISDTLLFTSPSTTKEDIDVANKLAKISKTNIDKYGYQMLKASSSVLGLSINEQLYQDYKSYSVGKLHVGLSQLITMDFENIKPNVNEYVRKLNEINELNNGVHAMFITDIIKKGSYVIYNSKSEEIIKEAFNLSEIYEGIFIPGIISRKKQMIPQIIEVIE